MIRNLRELWRFRALVWALVVRHLNARYRGSFLGFVWSLLNPLCLIAVYSLVFRYYIRVGDVEHYTLFVFAGLLPWIWFSSALNESSVAITGGGSLITKAMLPPHIFPVVSVLTNLANFIFALPILIGAMYVCDVIPSWGMLLLPAVIFVELVFVLGLALAFSALNVYYRDVQHILGNVLTFWFYLCPIIYTSRIIPEELQFTLWLNPVALFTEMYQSIFVDSGIPNLTALTATAAVAMITFLVGNWVFNRYREEFAELV